jgi:RimJ/RimL family protein N-acetyltransferase
MTMHDLLSRSDILVNRAETAVTILDNAAAPLATAQTAVGSWTVVLRDGSTALIRQVQAADAPLLANGFARLSAESRATRCLGAKKELSPAELRYLTDVDHHDHEALGALDHPSGQGVGIARYIRHPSNPQTAEIAVTVIDGWQGRGLGTELIKELSRRAWRAGIRSFTAVATTDNVAAVRLLRTMGARPVRRGAGTVEYEIALEPWEGGTGTGVR